MGDERKIAVVFSLKGIRGASFRKKNPSESVRCPRSNADLCPKIVGISGVSENCPKINDRYNAIHV